MLKIASMSSFKPVPADLSKALATRFARLKQKKHRQVEQLYLAEGLRTVDQLCRRLTQATAVSDAPEAIILSEDTLEQAQREPGSEAASLMQHVRQASALHPLKLYAAGSAAMQKLSDTRQPQGVLAVMHMPPRQQTEAWLEQLSTASDSFQPRCVMALDSVADPGNLGTLYRSAAWFGAEGLLLGEGCVDAYNPKVVRSTAGASGSLLMAEVGLPEQLDRLEAAGYQVLLLDLNPEACSLYEIFTSMRPAAPAAAAPKAAFVVGNEAHGVSEALRHRFPAVFIPGATGAVESLNAGVSGSIALSSFSAALHQAGWRF